MPRTARILLANTPHHLVQRGHNRRPVFLRASDYRYYLDTLIEWKRELQVKVYAYCLMTNHVHLIVEPGERVESVGEMMRRLAGRQTRLVNSLAGRTGTLWEGRYKASPIQTATYLLRCIRYVELNPIRAGLACQPENYQWSSFNSRIEESWPSWMDEDECYRSLGSTPEERRQAYRHYAQEQINADELSRIRTAVNRNQLTGEAGYPEEVERLIGRRIETRGRGRPRGQRK